MCSNGGAAASLELVRSGLRALVKVDVAGLGDEVVRAGVLELLAARNQVNAVLLAFVASFDVRELAEVDGFRGSRAWLTAFGRLSPYAATETLRKGRLLRELSLVAAAAGDGDVSDEHLTKLAKLVTDVGPGPAQRVEQTLAEFASVGTAAELGKLCDRIRAHVDPDGPEPDSADDFDRRGLTLARLGNMVALKGQLDLEGGATLLTALDALTKPPGPDDLRTAAQRRADALVDLCRLPLTADMLPTCGGVRPQVGILITPRTLTQDPPAGHNNRERDTGHDSRERDSAGRPHHSRERDVGGQEDCHRDRAGFDDPRPDPGWPASDNDPAARENREHDPAEEGVGDPLTAAGFPPLPEPAWMDWIGEVPTATAQRIACDASVWRVVLDPTTGLPLDLGRTYRTAPPWMRRALHARDRGCRWPGCDAPTPWTDAHHLNQWIYGGKTNIDQLLLLCRWHHVRVHEGQWSIHFDHATGEVTVARPDGRPYELGASRPYTGPSTRPA